MTKRIHPISLLVLIFGCHSPSADPSPDAPPKTVSAKQIAPSSKKAGFIPGPATDVVASIDLKTLFSTAPINGMKPIQITAKSDPFYNKALTGSGILLDTVLAQIPELEGLDRSAHSLRFVCTDGYNTTFSFASLEGARGLVASAAVEGGRPVPWPAKTRGKSQQTAGPYYLIWEGQEFDKHRPWPYQWSRLEIITNESVKKRLSAPLGVNVSEGQALFKTHCNACHSINLSGGKLGPELNVPKNIMTYRDRSQLLAFMKNPYAFRAGSLMPPTSLGDAQLNKILDYLSAMSSKQVCTTVKHCQDMLAKKPR